ncbi:MAG TPA: hypothetical protein DCE41_15015, partial [Cytophagales bacterium]|nr:hypothetical protein [Cytophagales bacterium]
PTVTCIGDGINLVFDESILRAYYGGTVTITVDGVTDALGNPAASHTYSFVIGQWGTQTSPVSLVGPTDAWLINTTETTVDFTLADYDVFEVEHSLDYILLQYAPNHSGEWITIDTTWQEDLVAYYTANNTAGEAARFTTTWTPTLAEGSYAVRPVAYGDYGFPEYSGTLGGTVDTSVPFITSFTPGDDTLRFGETIVISYSEDLASASFESSDLDLKERIVTETNGIYDTTYVKVPSTEYLTQVSGSNVTLFFEEGFTATYDGADLRIQLSGLTDANNNATDTTLNQVIAVENVIVTGGGSQRLQSLNLAGEHREDGQVALHWNAISVDGIAFYAVERSTDGTYFESVGTVVAGSEAEYEFLDAVDFDTQIFYRLRLVSTAKELQSRTIAIQDNGLAMPLSVEVFPNPIEDSRVAFTWTSKGSEEHLTVEIRDLRGALLHTETLDATSRGLQQSVQLPTHLQSGLYLLQISQENDTQSVQFVVR